VVLAIRISRKTAASMLPSGVKLPLRRHIKVAWERLLPDGNKLVVTAKNNDMEYVVVTYS
jgi:hypothetical protein